MKNVILLIAIVFSGFKFSYSQSGQLDPSFGTNGIVKTDLGFKVTNSSSITDILLEYGENFYVFFQKDYQNYILKHLSNGAIDSTYGGGGFSRALGFQPNNAVLQPDGKIVFIGDINSDFAVARFNIAGTRDSSFSDDGVQVTDFNSSYDIAYKAAIQIDGKIVVVGLSSINDNQYVAVTRYNADGSLDSSFSDDGKLLTNLVPYYSGPGAIAIQSDGKIVIAVSTLSLNNLTDFVVARYNRDGSTDSSFSEDGKQTTDFQSKYDAVTSVSIQSDGKIVAAGNSNSNFAIARYNADGSPDNTFSEDGKQVTIFPGFQNSSLSSLAFEANDKIIAAGFAGNEGTSDFALARYNYNGSLDKSFSSDGLQTTDFGYPFDYPNAFAAGIALQPDGKILATGLSALTASSFFIGRYNTNGSLDKTYDGDGKLIQSLSFDEGNTQYVKAAIQRDGKIVAAGHTLKEIDVRDPILVRYNTNGSLDSSFSNDGMQTADVNITSIAVQRDGKIVVAGQKIQNYYFTVSRYNTDGSLDSSFSNDGELRSDVSMPSIAIQSDGKIVVAGGNDLINADFALARYNVDGSPDSSFSGDGKQKIDFGDQESANSLALQDDGKIVVAGTQFYLGKLAIARLNSDGSLDKSFSSDGKDSANFAGEIGATSVAVGRDGKIVVGGIFPYLQDLSSFIVRYNSNGTIDSSFSDDGKELTNFGNGSISIGIQTDGKIVVCNSSSPNSADPVSVIARYNANGILDSTFSEDGIIQTAVLTARSIVFENNKLYVVGSAYNGPFGGGTFGAVARYLIDRNENKPRNVKLSIPYNVVKYTAPARIKLNAAATDEDGKITKVQFYNDTAILHTETEFPYGFLWIDVPVGSYSFTAKAFDDSGNVTTSNNINVSVVDTNVAPVVNIASPVDDTTYTGPAAIRIVANAKDPNEKISKVEFYSGTTLIRTENYYPYTYTWTNVKPGTYTITAKAYDEKGLSTISDPVTVTVKAQATVNITPNKDNTIYSTSPEYSNGLGVELLTGRQGSSTGFTILRSLLHFDLSSIPAGSRIDSAALTLQLGNYRSGGVSLHKLTTNWGEGTSGGGRQGSLAAEGDATWIYAFFPISNGLLPEGILKVLLLLVQVILWVTR